MSHCQSRKNTTQLPKNKCSIIYKDNDKEKSAFSCIMRLIRSATGINSVNKTLILDKHFTEL